MWHNSIFLLWGWVLIRTVYALQSAGHIYYFVRFFGYLKLSLLRHDAWWSRKEEQKREMLHLVSQNFTYSLSDGRAQKTCHICYNPDLSWNLQKKIKQSDSDKMQNHWPEIILMNCLWLILAKTYVPHRWTNMQMGASQMMIETSNKGNGSVAPQHRMHSEMTNEDMMVADQEWSHARGRCISQVSAYSPHHGMKNNYWYTCNICSCLPVSWNLLIKNSITVNKIYIQ